MAFPKSWGDLTPWERMERLREIAEFDQDASKLREDLQFLQKRKQLCKNLGLPPDVSEDDFHHALKETIAREEDAIAKLTTMSDQEFATELDNAAPRIPSKPLADEIMHKLFPDRPSSGTDTSHKR